MIVEIMEENCFVNPIVKVDVMTKKVLFCRLKEMWDKENIYNQSSQESTTHCL